MRHVVLAPDSYKGTLSSRQICRIMAEAVRRHFPACRVEAIPAADGGEGSVDCLLEALGGIRREVRVRGPFGEGMTAAYGLLADGKTAIVETASCAGLPLAEGRRDPRITTTYGVGQLLLDAAEQGCRTILLGLGGSCTNDAGAGAAAAAGVRFYDRQGRAFIPTGGTLADVARIDASGLDPRLRGVEIRGLCDIDNPLHGETGAALVFAPQKGADPAAVRLLDEGLAHIGRLMERDLGCPAASLPGGGAAGGFGAGLAAFLGGRLCRGIETVLDTVRFDERTAGADLVFTGEGRLDRQSLSGKVISGVADRAAALGVPVIAVVGGYDPPLEDIHARGVAAVFSINRLPEELSASRTHSGENLSLTMDNILRLLKLRQD